MAGHAHNTAQDTAQSFAQSFDARELRNVLGAFVTGVTVITALDRDGRPHGLTANSFSSVSLDPPLILWSQSLASPSHPVFLEAERFVVNILADDQVAVSKHFARGGDDKFAGCETRPGLGGVPLIAGCAAYLECRRIAATAARPHPTAPRCRPAPARRLSAAGSVRPAAGPRTRDR